MPSSYSCLQPRDCIEKATVTAVVAFTKQKAPNMENKGHISLSQENVRQFVEEELLITCEKANGLNEWSKRINWFLSTSQLANQSH